MFANKREKNNKTVKWKKLEELILPNAMLRFCPDQLHNLNYIFHKKLQPNAADQTLEKSLRLAKSVTERLIQKLLCGAGMADSRFASKYLISNKNGENENLSNSLEYIVRLDTLSTPLLYQNDSVPQYEVIENDCECPSGFARLRLHASTLNHWREYTNPSGYLRRDKVQARLVELLALAATQEHPDSPLQVDESILCGIPGKVVDPYTLQEILKVPPNQHVYYGPGGNVPRFPDTRDFRLAIVDEPNGIKIRVEFLSPSLSNLSIKVRILVAIGVDAWPSSSDYPGRVPLGHPDCLLLYQSGNTGMYLVGYGVHSSAWQMRLPAAEYCILNHYGNNSTVKTILDILYEILNDIDCARGMRKPISYKILNKYMLFTILIEELEDTSKTPFKDLVKWSPIYLSTLVLTLLDKVIIRLQEEFQPNYFFKKANLLVNPGHLCDDDFTLEANNVKGYMIRLFDESLVSNRGNAEFSNLLLSQESEMVLLYKWKELVDGLLPPSGTRGRRFCFAGSKSRQDIANTQYTTRQLEYIRIVIHYMLKVKQSILQSDQNLALDNASVKSFSDDRTKGEQLEDIIYILVNILEQAKDQYLLRNVNPNNPNANKTNIKIRLSFATHSSKLIDQIRKEKELQNLEFKDDLSLVKIILRCLYKAMDQHKKVLGSILRPYLNTIFTTSHAVSCQIDQIKERTKTDEIEAMGSFAQLVNSNDITPAQGLLDSVNKEWEWAKSMLNMVEKNTLRVVFIAERYKVYNHILSLPSYSKTTDFKEADVDKVIRTFEGMKNKAAVKRRTTLPARTYFSSLLLNETAKNGNFEIPQHEILKTCSPLTKILEKIHRRGQHRGSGDILRSMAAMQKLNLFQEAASSLSQEDRSGLQEVIQNIHHSKVKRSSSTKRWSQTLPRFSSNSKVVPQSKGETLQRYTPKEECAGIQVLAVPKTTNAIILGSTKVNSLLGTCRAARLREDNSMVVLQDSFKVQALLKKSESFKY